MDLPLTIILAAGTLVLVFIVALALVARFIHVVSPGEVLVFSGRSHSLPDGSRAGFRVIHGGRAFQVPIVEAVDSLGVGALAVEGEVRNAYSKGGIPLSIELFAVVHVSTEPHKIVSAIERFMGRSPREIITVARETVEGNLRQVIATLTPEEVVQDRLRLARNVIDEAEEDMDRLGLSLELLQILRVTDDAGYLDSMGRKEVARALRASALEEVKG